MWADKSILMLGRRVMHDETRKEGVIVMEPAKSATRVLVQFDGADAYVPCHPDSLEFTEEQSA